jgi:hypothetical protein
MWLTVLCLLFDAAGMSSLNTGPNRHQAKKHDGKDRTKSRDLDKKYGGHRKGEWADIAQDGPAYVSREDPNYDGIEVRCGDYSVDHAELN